MRNFINMSFKIQKGLKNAEDYLIGHSLLLLATASLLLIVAILAFYYQTFLLHNNMAEVNRKDVGIEKQLAVANSRFQDLKNQNQYKINQKLQGNLKDIEDTYKQSVDLYQRILDLEAQNQNTNDLNTSFAQVLNYLSQDNYSSAEASLKSLTLSVQTKENSLAQNLASVQNISVSNSLPSFGFSEQQVTTGNGNFTVSIIAADLNSTKVIIDTASGGDCGNNCPTLPLSDYVARNGAFAGINGSFFCPADYPGCAGKTGSFDTLLMNKNKVYFNSSNNVYSTVPLVVFKDNWAKFFTQSLQWGRDTSPDAVLAMQPLLVFSGQNVYSGSGLDKYNIKSTRDFVANKGSMVYIGVIYNATMSDAANVLKTLGVDNALNLDEGGSTALWYGGYKAGPGRNIPNALLFVKK